MGGMFMKEHTSNSAPKWRAYVSAPASAAALVIGLAAPAWGHDVTERVSLGRDGVQGNGFSFSSTGSRPLSADGRFVAFDSFATNLVPGDTNNRRDVFVRDRQGGTTRRVSLGSGGAQGNGDSVLPSISAGGRFVAFISGATNLVPGDTNGFIDVFVRDRQAGTTERVSLGPDGVQGNGGDSRFVAFTSGATNLVPGDTNGVEDVFVRVPLD
jgi:hypothetical protein